MKDPHQNVFYYYRGPSSRKETSLYDVQIEDNTTKSFINLLELCHDIGFNQFLENVLEELHLPNCPSLGFKLQRGLETGRPDALIEFLDYTVYIESKVKAPLDTKQIERHLKGIGKQDNLVVITNNQQDKECVGKLQDSRVIYLCWAKLHSICLKTISMARNEKTDRAIVNLMKQFTDYLEVIVMPGFCGFKDADFDFWVDPNQNYVPVLRKKMNAFAALIMARLPAQIRNEYSLPKVGNISRKICDDRFAWVAIKRPTDKSDRFNQCNFTIEVSKNGLEINCVIRNGRSSQASTPIGVMFNKFQNDSDGFLSAISGIHSDARLVVFKRLPRRGERVGRGNERWQQFFDMKLEDINTKDDIDYICNILKKAALPGIHIKYLINRGDKILSDTAALEEKTVNTIVNFNPVLKYLKDM